MCSVLLAKNVDPEYPLIIIGNRDEFYKRPSDYMHWWNETILAGKDLEAGGTWLGLNKKGKCAIITNIRNMEQAKTALKSRGEIPVRYLSETRSPNEFTTDLLETNHFYNGFNLLFGDINSLHFYSSQEKKSSLIPDGVHGLSNATLNTPWFKVEHGKNALNQWIRKKEKSVEGLFALLANQTKAPDHLLPQTGISYEWEKRLSSLFIESETYGTRCSTVILVDRKNTVQVIERNYHIKSLTDTSFTFSINC